MLAYDYEVKGSPEALADVRDGNGNGYKIEINHEAKQVTLNKW